MSRTLASEIELSLISFDGSDSTLTWQGVDKRTTKKARGVRGGGRLFEGSDYFKYFRLKKAINRGTAIIPGNTVVQRLHYFKFEPI